MFIDDVWLQNYLNGNIVKLEDNIFIKEPVKYINCVDGSIISVQASKYHYSKPKENIGPYTHVEYCYIINGNINTVYGYEEINKVIDRINSHGGIIIT